MRFVRRFGYVAVATVLLASAAGAHHVSAAPMMALPNCQGKPEIKPSSVLFACADGNFAAQKLTWSGWGNGTTTAVGVAQSNDCTPNCAAGHMHSYRIRVIVSGHQTCPGGEPAYANATFAWIGESPGGSPYSLKYPCTSR